MSRAKKVLVIDDEKVVCNSCRRVLEEEGYDVSVAADGREAMEKMWRESFDAALVDLRMPGLGGMDVVRAVRNRRLDTRVIVITGFSSVATAVEAMQLGAADYLPKPFTPKELSDRLRSVLEADNKTSRLRLEKETLSPEKRALGGVRGGTEGSLAEARILLAGSDTEQMVTICQCLFSETWHVSTAETHEEVIEKVKAGQVDVLIAGVDVFGVKAYQLIPRLRRMGCSIPIIVASADSSLEMAQKVRELGIFFYLMEPFDPWEVRSVVRDAVRKAATLQAEDWGASHKFTVLRSVRTLANNGTKVGLVAIGEGIAENSALYREIIAELKGRSLPIQIELAHTPITAREFPRYLEQDHRVVMIVPFEGRAEENKTAVYSASMFEMLATKEQQRRLREVAYPEVLHWLRAQGIAPEVRIVCLPEAHLASDQANDAANIITKEGLA